MYSKSMDTWASIQENKRNQDSLRERIKRRKKERQDLIKQTSSLQALNSTLNNTTEQSSCENSEKSSPLEDANDISIDKITEFKLQQYLCSHSLNFPLDSATICRGLNKILNNQSLKTITTSETEILIQKQAAQLFLTLSLKNDRLAVLSVDHGKLSAVVENVPDVANVKSISIKDKEPSRIEKLRRNETKYKTESHRTNQSKHERQRMSKDDRHKHEKVKKNISNEKISDIEALLSTKSAKEQDSKKIADEIQELLSTSTTKEIILAKNFRSLGGSQVKEFCTYGTREECVRRRGSSHGCKKVHFKKILKPHTDESLGDCSFLNTCFHMDTCKYVHYEIDYRGTDLDPKYHRKQKRKLIESKSDLLDDQDYLSRKMLPPQWINCDVRYIDMSVLGKFSVIMADPPWDIHMELPYGTMQDDEMRALRIQDLSDDGLMFLWVTGRAMELGRELFNIWGYKRCDELIWVKTNQLQRLIRTGRTGHWLNHGKEHCLIGIKGNPQGINRGLDCDVLVAEVRDTSHKPDEIYGIIERLSPGTRKLEIFGRMHNVQPNWVTLGNQLDGVHLTEPDFVNAFKLKYPDGKVTNPKSK